jgi:hypothetical protein
MFNFTSLEAIITGNKKDDETALHIEAVANTEQVPYESPGPSSGTNDTDPQEGSSKRSTPDIAIQPPEYVNTSESTKNVALEPVEALEESVTTLKPGIASSADDEIASVPPIEVVPNNHSHGLDTKHIGEISMLDSLGHQPTQ